MGQQFDSRPRCLRWGSSPTVVCAARAGAVARQLWRALAHRQSRVTGAPEPSITVRLLPQRTRPSATWRPWH